jgi:hypothetical protein
MRVGIGTLVMRCLACQAEEWRATDASAPLALLSEVICLGCGAQSSCADLALQLPLVPEPAADAAE